MNGVDLKELDASEMLDVIHYFFEEDLKAATKEEIDAKDAIRNIIYEDFYSHKYFLSNTRNKDYASNASGDFFEESFKDITPFDPNIKKSSKRYIAPTNFDSNLSKPFGDILDEPLN
jgi:hypothetical protein